MKTDFLAKDSALPGPHAAVWPGHGARSRPQAIGALPSDVGGHGQRRHCGCSSFPQGLSCESALELLSLQATCCNIICTAFSSHSAAMLHIGQSCPGSLALLLKGVHCSYCSTLFLQPPEAVSFGVVSPVSDIRNGLVWFAGIEEVILPGPTLQMVGQSCSAMLCQALMSTSHQVCSCCWLDLVYWD